MSTRPAAGWPVIAVALLAGCPLDVVYPAGDSASDDETGPIRTAATPVAPTAAAPMWQGLQEVFLDADGAPCTAPVAAAMGDAAFCFVGADEQLWCAGRVEDEDFGPTFVGTGIRSARQVHVSPTLEDTEALCVVGDGVLQCLGGNRLGQLANGGTGANDTFLPWGSVTGVVGAATGTWDQVCVLDTAGEAWCAGDGYGVTPARVGNGAALLVDTFGAASLDDPDRWRASAERSDCFVTAGGLDCGVPLGDMELPALLGEAGHVVDGGALGSLPRTACWLDDAGGAWCGESTSAAEPVFAEQPVLLLAVNGHSDGLCAIHADGSVACKGTNTNGRFGTGSLADLFLETTVAPPGTVDTRCR